MTAQAFLERLDENTKKIAEHDVMFRNILEVLATIQEQTSKIPQIERDINQLQNDVSVIKKVIIDRNKQISRHERFINAIKAA